MSWKVIDVDESSVVNKWGTGKLTAELIAASDLEEEKVYELLRGDMNISTSKADCVLRACQRLRQAKEANEKVFVGGDYDADGICSTAIMKKTLDVFGIENGYYIPDRFKEGYGLSAKTVEAAYQKGYSIIMTVDNGVKAHEALRKAKELGMYVIVTDHHEIEEEIEADIVVHPDYMESQYAYLSGAGVALEISRNLIGESSEYDDLIAICAVALIGDVMPLWRETRKLVKRGLSILKQRRPLSLAVLLRPGTAVDETAVSFNIVPKLNSVGRMNDISNVNTLVPYLLSRNEKVIADYSQQLNLVNERRKELSVTQTELAQKQMDESDVQILYHEQFHEGICGLIAGKIANTYHKPVIVMAKNDSLLKGSGRSVPGFNLFDFLSGFEELVAFGGHEQAVGLSIKADDFASFQSHVNQEFQKGGYVFEQNDDLAIRITPDEISFDAIMDIQTLSPYPKEMFQPFFALEKPVILEKKYTAKTIRYTVGLGGQSMDAIIYTSRNLPDVDRPELLIGKLGINRFRGKITLQMIVEHVA